MNASQEHPVAAEPLSVYAHEVGYEPVYIVGTPHALRALRDVLSRALQNNRAEASRAISQDGDEYAVVIVPTSGVCGAPRSLLTAADAERIFGRKAL